MITVDGVLFVCLFVCFLLVVVLVVVAMYFVLFFNSFVVVCLLIFGFLFCFIKSLPMWVQSNKVEMLSEIQCRTLA